MSPVDLLGLPPRLATVIQKIIRHNGLKLDQIAAELDQTPAETQMALEELVDKGYVRRVEVRQELWYKARFGRKADRTRRGSVWSALNELIEEED